MREERRNEGKRGRGKGLKGDGDNGERKTDGEKEGKTESAGR